MQKKWFVLGFAAVAAVAIACGESTKTPASPTAVNADTAAAASDGSTLKSNPPSLSAPAEGSTVDSLVPSLIVINATSRFVSFTAPYYRFMVVDSTNATIYTSAAIDAGSVITGNRVPSGLLKAEQTYRWRARAESGGSVGPWTNYFSFKTPKGMTDAGYQTATAVWDPLTNGKSIGASSGMEFSAEGARTLSTLSNIRYDLLQTMTAGEFSYYAYNLNPLSAGNKTKLMSMQEGTSDLTTNRYRFTVEKRGVGFPIPGQVRIRIIVGDANESAGRIFDSVPEVALLEKAVWYFVRVTWGASRATLQIFNANGTTGAIGAQVFFKDMGYGSFTYRPVPHTAWLGAPVGRGGPEDASLPNMTVKWLWIGAAGTPRPGFTQASTPGE